MLKKILQKSNISLGLALMCVLVSQASAKPPKLISIKAVDGELREYQNG